MKMRDIVSPGAVVPRLASVERDEVIVELVDALINSGIVEARHRKAMLDAVLERERKGSTGFGKGVAIPHVKLSGLKKMSAAIGVSERGIDFNALDKQPVYSVFLLVSPANDPEAHLRAMEIIFRNLSQDVFRRFLRQASTVDQVMTLMDDADNNTLPG
ncbi:MAG: PTS sugar transporter subunit IIA [Phycisphaerales bacterium]